MRGTLLLLVVSLTPVVVQPEHDAALSITLAAVDGAEVVVGDPVLLVLTVRNDGEVPVRIFRPEVDPPAGPTVKFELARGEGEFSEVVVPGIGRQKRLGSPVVDVAPGQELDFLLRLSWDFPPQVEQRRYLFTEPGEYRMRASVASGVNRVHRNPVLQSAPVSVRVVLPEAERDRKAWEQWSSLDTAWRFYAPWSTHSPLPESIERFRAEHAESRYAKFADLAILHGQFITNWGDDDPKQKLEIYDQCARLLERARQEKWPAGWIAVAEEMLARMGPAVRPYCPEAPVPYWWGSGGERPDRPPPE